MARRARGGRDRPHHLLPVGREHRDAAQHDLAQGGRQAVGVPAEHRAHRLLGDERVARRPLPDQCLQVRPARRPLRNELGQHLARQRIEIERRHLLVAPQLGERHREVRGGAGGVVAEGGHHQHRLVREDGDEVGDEVPGGPIGPVQVLDHQQHRPQLGQFRDRLVEQVEQPHRRTLAAGGRQPFQPLRQPRPDLVIGPGPHRGAQRRQHGPERWRVGDVDGVAGEHHRIRAPRPPHELADQLRLADARIAADQHGSCSPFAGRLEGVRQRGQLVRASTYPLHSHWCVRLPRESPPTSRAVRVSAPVVVGVSGRAPPRPHGSARPGAGPWRARGSAPARRAAAPRRPRGRGRAPGRAVARRGARSTRALARAGRGGRTGAPRARARAGRLPRRGPQRTEMHTSFRHGEMNAGERLVDLRCNGRGWRRRRPTGSRGPAGCGPSRGPADQSRTNCLSNENCGRPGAHRSAGQNRDESGVSTSSASTIAPAGVAAELQLRVGDEDPAARPRARRRAGRRRGSGRAAAPRSRPRRAPRRRRT